MLHECCLAQAARQHSCSSLTVVYPEGAPHFLSVYTHSLSLVEPLGENWRSFFERHFWSLFHNNILPYSKLYIIKHLLRFPQSHLESITSIISHPYPQSVVFPNCSATLSNPSMNYPPLYRSLYTNNPCMERIVSAFAFTIHPKIRYDTVLYRTSNADKDIRRYSNAVQRQSGLVLSSRGTSFSRRQFLGLISNCAFPHPNSILAFLLHESNHCISCTKQSCFTASTSQ